MRLDERRKDGPSKVKKSVEPVGARLPAIRRVVVRLVHGTCAGSTRIAAGPTGRAWTPGLLRLSPADGKA